MNVLDEILKWSKSRPNWQQDALRRLVLNGTLENHDYVDLVAICKSKHGLEDPQPQEPLLKDHIPQDRRNAGVVTLVDVKHLDGVNALASDQKVSFGPQLTVVYGDNASGKSGYTRILKSACKARGAEEILGNVLSGAAPPTQSVAIQYSVGGGKPQKWPNGDTEEGFLERVSVFDSHSAAVYLKEKTDVAFRPFGLDVFDKLSNACEEIQRRLKRERRALDHIFSFPEVPEETEVSNLVQRITSLTKPEKVKELATLSDENTERITFLKKQLSDLQAKDPAKAARELQLRAARFRSFAKHLKTIEQVLGSSFVDKLFAARADVAIKLGQASKLRESTFSDALMEGIGSDNWKVLWSAAREFSHSAAYTGKAFPVVEDARCVLCHQDIDEAAAIRLKQFEVFVTSETERELREARQSYNAIFEEFGSLRIEDDETNKNLEELSVEHDDLASTVENTIVNASGRHAVIKTALEKNNPLPTDIIEIDKTHDRIVAVATQLEERGKELLSNVDQARRDKLSAELNELLARVVLKENQDLVFGEIERLKKIAAYGLCIEDTKTTAITRKSTDITKKVVTETLKKSFKDELASLNFKHVEVELKDVGGERGALYHKVMLTRAPGVEVPKVVSEGEARCLSIAAFFAELSTADDPSTILFDDPVSSLDHKWRTNVAARLISEAKTRQVVVFYSRYRFLTSAPS